MRSSQKKYKFRALRFCSLILLTACSAFYAEALTSCSQVDEISYLVVYRADANGTINGKARVVQSVMAGGASVQVVAKPMDGYRFLCWDDGSENAVRTDSEIYESFERIAYFAMEDHEP